MPRIEEGGTTMKAGWVALAALGFGAAGLDGAGAQGIRAQGAAETASAIAVPATVQRPGAKLTRFAPPEDGQGFAGADSAAGAADTLGQSATPPTLPAGTFAL